jgi:phosphonate ABC transporter permease subunit PhnE
MSNKTQSEVVAKQATRHLVRTILIIFAILVVYALAINATGINLEKPLDVGRQENVLRTLRILADPDLVRIDDETGDIELSDVTKITFNRIIETILMALLASAFGTALAIPISFLAARNLMADLTAPLAAIMFAVLALPVGGWLGWKAASLVGQFGNQIGSVQSREIIALLVTIALIWLLIRAWPSRESREDQSTFSQLLFVLRILLLISLVYLGLVFLADFGLLLGDWLEENLGPFGFLGNFIILISDVIRILLPVLFGLFSGLVMASYASRYGQEAVIRWNEKSARILTSILSTFGIAAIIIAISFVINWFYQHDTSTGFAPILATFCGITLAILLLNLTSKRNRLFAITGAVLIWGLVFLISKNAPFNSVNQAILTAAGISGVIGGVMVLKVPPKKPLPIGFGTYTVTRTLLNILRSIEPLIMGIVFVVWVSLGPFAGVMALTLHTIAALGKLFSEQIEGISQGPIEAVTATGASRVQMIVYAVIPQVVPPFTAFALYRWDINVRMSTIIGFVGGGGIGFILSQYITQARYRQASVVMIAIAIVVAALDYASSRIRSRII